MLAACVNIGDNRCGVQAGSGGYRSIATLQSLPFVEACANDAAGLKEKNVLKKMLRTSVGGVALLVLLAGCAHHHPGRAPNAAFPQISLAANGKFLVVNQEPIVLVRRPNETVVVTFQVSRGIELTFDDGGVDIIGKIVAKEPGRPTQIDPFTPAQKKELFNCVANEGRTEVACRIAPSVPRGQYLYTVRAVKKSGDKIVLDPTVYIEDEPSP